jgi:hypothetical protein
MISLEGVEWVSWSPETAQARPEIEEAIEQFASLDIEAGRAAEAWLRESALPAHPACVTNMLLHEGGVQGYYALTMGEVQLSGNHRKRIGVTFPRQGAVLIPWLARAREPTMPDGFEHLLLHAVGLGRRGAEFVGAAVIALDPFDEATAERWLARGFIPSQTVREGQPPRLWRPLWPNQ